MKNRRYFVLLIVAPLGACGDATQFENVRGTETQEPPDFVGIWARDPKWCESTTGTEVPIELTAKSFSGYDTPCDIKKVDKLDSKAWRTQLLCKVGNKKQDRLITILLEGDRMDIVHHDMGDEWTQYYRCPSQTHEPSNTTP